MRLLLLPVLAIGLALPLPQGASARASGSLSQEQQTENKVVAGRITDSDGQPLAGVFVMIKGTNIGVQSDSDGLYSIKIPADGSKATLYFQYLGMKSKEVEVSGPRTLNVVMESDNVLASSIIVGAYGSKQTREDLVGSAFQVNSDKIASLPKDRIESMLTGLVPGLTVQPNADYAASPRTRYNIRVRGNASLNASNEPLWIIDGAPVYMGNATNTMPGMSYTVSPLSYLNPDDIESITVLKDADQTSIYGANGSNGVIIVTLKSGTFDTPLKINASLSFGVSTPDYSTMFKMMNAEQYMEVAKEAWVNSGSSIDSFPYNDNPYTTYSGVSTDWARLYLDLATTKNISVSLRNGTKKMANTLSASYFDDNTVQHSNRTRRFTFSERNEMKFGSRVDFNIGINASYTRNDIYAIGNSYLEALPILSPYNDDGTYRLYYYTNYYVDDSGEEHYTRNKFYDNDIPDAKENEDKQITVVTGLNAQLKVKIIEGLNASSQFKINYQHSHEDTMSSVKTLDGQDSSGEPYGASSRADASYTDWTNVNQLTFDRTFGKHRVYGMGALELRHHLTKTLSGSGYGFPNDYIQELSYLDKSNIYTYSSTSPTRNLSYFGRLEYNYGKRYYIAANYRRDGASDFGEYSKWGAFWSVGVSYNMHNENWFNVNAINMLKLKVSVGDNGNSRTSNSSYEGTYNYGSSYAYGGEIGAELGTVANPYLSWEKTRNLNTGIRMELLDHRISFEIEYYRNLTRDLLSRVYTSRTISSDRIWANVGKLRNQGIELNLETVNVKTPDFVWSTTFNISHNDNEITELYNGMRIGYGTTVDAVGYPTGALYLVKWAGVDPSDGMPMWYDLDGNITKTYSSDNRRIYDNQEIAYGSLSNDFTYKNWTLGIQINYNIGGKALASYADRFMNDGYDIISGNQAVEVYYYRWKEPGDLASFPKVSNTSTGSTYSSTRNVYDKTYFDLYNVSLTYSVPDRITSALKIGGASFNLAANNLYFLTPHQSSKYNSYKTMAFGYPRVRKITLTLNVSF